MLLYPYVPRRFYGYPIHHAATGYPGLFWFGAIIAVLFALLLWFGLRPGGEFPSRPPFPRADRDHPLTFWVSAAACAAILAVGLYMMACGLTGAPPFS